MVSQDPPISWSYIDDLAGEIMYLQGRRFASAGSSSKVTVFDLLAMQGRSYLAAINALSLVDKRSAWISVARPPHEAKRVGTLTFKREARLSFRHPRGVERQRWYRKRSSRTARRSIC